MKDLNTYLYNEIKHDILKALKESLKCVYFTAHRMLYDITETVRVAHQTDVSYVCMYHSLFSAGTMHMLQKPKACAQCEVFPKVLTPTDINEEAEHDSYFLDSHFASL